MKIMKVMPYFVIALICVFIFFAAIAVKDMFAEVAIVKSSREFKITQGQTVRQISKSLEDREIIKSDFWFRILVWLMQEEPNFIAGTFELPDEISSFSLINLLTTKGKGDVKTIKILEGWGVDDISKYLEEQGLFSSNEFLIKSGELGKFSTLDRVFEENLLQEHPLLKYKPVDAPLEGYLFPDTYEVYADSSPDDIIRKMISNFSSKVTDDLIEEINRQGKDFYQVLIMASIIEAEVPNDEDRAIVSGIFWSRLDLEMPLQSCATLNYKIGGTNPALTAEQLKIDSEYNTYMYKGLPPTPIGNPGLSSIRAAIYPADTDYLYFLSTPEGETIFSKTLDEHNVAKAKYLQ